jgi:hypothetical protein
LGIEQRGFQSGDQHELKNPANHPTCPVYKMKNYSIQMGFDAITKTFVMANWKITCHFN